jgi:hypothetical protein
MFGRLVALAFYVEATMPMLGDIFALQPTQFRRGTFLGGRLIYVA